MYEPVIFSVIPAKTGIHTVYGMNLAISLTVSLSVILKFQAFFMDSRLRGNDGKEKDKFRKPMCEACICPLAVLFYIFSFLFRMNYGEYMSHFTIISRRINRHMAKACAILLKWPYTLCLCILGFLACFFHLMKHNIVINPENPCARCMPETTLIYLDKNLKESEHVV